MTRAEFEETLRNYGSACAAEHPHIAAVCHESLLAAWDALALPGDAASPDIARAVEALARLGGGYQPTKPGTGGTNPPPGHGRAASPQGERARHWPKCATCANDATCLGVYEDPAGEPRFACDVCCGHGNEDGTCFRMPGKDRRSRLLPIRCPECKGQGGWNIGPDSTYRKCGKCNGTGRALAAAPRAEEAPAPVCSMCRKPIAEHEGGLWCPSPAAPEGE